MTPCTATHGDLTDVQLRILRRVKYGPLWNGAPCWIPQLSDNGRGYRQITIAGRTKLVHRVAYEAWKGPIPDGLHIDHLCRNRGCCNPDHLEAVTCGENTFRSPLTLNSINAAKTHCAHGHEYTVENTRLRPTGGRACRSCDRIYKSRAREKLERKGQVA